MKRGSDLLVPRKYRGPIRLAAAFCLLTDLVLEPAMADLAGVLGLEKKYAESEKVGREALEIGHRVLGDKDPTMAILFYNLGALAGLRHRTDEAITLLNQAIDAGLPPGVPENIEQDPDLTPLHGNDKFPALVAHGREVAKATNKGE